MSVSPDFNAGSATGLFASELRIRIQFSGGLDPDLNSPCPMHLCICFPKFTEQGGKVRIFWQFSTICINKYYETKKITKYYPVVSGFWYCFFSKWLYLDPVLLKDWISERDGCGSGSTMTGSETLVFLKLRTRCSHLFRRGWPIYPPTFSVTGFFLLSIVLYINIYTFLYILNSV